MKIITSTTLARETKIILDKIEEGQQLIIMRHSKPIAVLSPIEMTNVDLAILNSVKGNNAPTNVPT